MKNPDSLRRTFVLFHLVLGLALFSASVMTALSGMHGNPHIRLLGGVEAVGALLFLVPRTLRIGACVLLLTIALAVAIHGAMGEWRVDLLVYAAGVAFVAVHGAAYTHASGAARAS